jgi:branched-chain amino acid transport system ATP-binding protein
LNNHLPPILSLKHAVSGYGNKQVVMGVDIDISAGEIVALIGHNGAGKSTLLKTAFGLLPLKSGEILLDGKRLHQHQRASSFFQHGLRFVMQGNRVFSDISVRENLEIGGQYFLNTYELSRAVERCYAVFPALKGHRNRAAGTLSGGQRQMLALATALITAPRLMLLDEPLLGLAPHSSQNALEVIKRLRTSEGMAFLIVEQKVQTILEHSDRAYVLRGGKVTYSGAPEALKDASLLRNVFL